MAVLTEEQSMLRDAARSWVQEKSPVTAFRKMRDSGVELGYDAVMLMIVRHEAARKMRARPVGADLQE